MRTLKTLVVVSFTFASLFLTYNLIALDSDVGAGTDTWDGVFVWGFESWNTNRSPYWGNRYRRV